MVGTAAAINPQPPAMTVSPAYSTVQVGSKQPQSSLSVGVRNSYDVPITILASLSGLDVHSNALVPTATPEKTVSRLVSISPTEIVVPAHGSKNIIVTIKDDPSLSPGGHYLSLLLTQASVASDQKIQQVSLKTAVSATIYLVKEDGAVRSVDATSLRISRSLFSLPTTANIRFHNTGNVVIIPRGVVTIGQVRKPILGQAVVNQDSVPLYPGSATTLQAVLHPAVSDLWPGRYYVQLQYRPDGLDATKVRLVQFWYVPIFYIFLIVILAIIIMALILPKTRRWLLASLSLKPRRQTPPYAPPQLHEAATVQPANMQNKRYNDIIVHRTRRRKK